MAISAGIDTGKRISGNITSRLRVRNDMAAKNVPFTTSDHVPNAASITNWYTGPIDRKL